MGIEIYKKEQEKIEKEEKRKTNPEEEGEILTVSEIISDNEKSYLFGEMVKQEGGDEEVMARLAKGKLEEKDIEILEKHRKVFEKRIRDAEKIKGGITKEMVSEIALQNPEFQKIINLNGPEKAAKIIEGQMNELAVTDNARFLSVYEKIEKSKTFKNEETKRLDDSVKELCKKENVNADEFFKALAITDDSKREDAVRKLVENSWSGTKKLTAGILLRLNIKDSSYESTNNLLNKKAEIDAFYEELDKNKKSIGSALASTIKSNKGMLEALSKGIIGKPTKPENPIGMREAAGSFPDNESIDEEWEELKKKSKWDTLDETKKESVRKGFGEKLKKESGEKAKNKKGFWTSILQSLFNINVDDKISKLK